MNDSSPKSEFLSMIETLPYTTLTQFKEVLRLETSLDREQLTSEIANLSKKIVRSDQSESTAPLTQENYTAFKSNTITEQKYIGMLSRAARGAGLNL